MKTTLNKIRESKISRAEWKELLTCLGKKKADDEELSLVTIIDCIGVYGAAWCLCEIDGYIKEKILFATWCARQCQHMMGDKSLFALKVAERFAHGKASQAELQIAADGAMQETKDAHADNESAFKEMPIFYKNGSSILPRVGKTMGKLFANSAAAYAANSGFYKASIFNAVVKSIEALIHKETHGMFLKYSITKCNDAYSSAYKDTMNSIEKELRRICTACET